MSKYFRTLSSSSSSSGETSTDSEHGANSIRRQAILDDGSAEALSTALNGLSLPDRSSSNGSHSQMLLHALLEERCMNDVLREHRVGLQGTQRPDDANLQAEATARYQKLCALLAPHNLISSGLEHDGLSSTRQRYREGLDLLSRSAITTAAQRPSVPAPLRRLLTENDASHLSTSRPQALQLARMDSDASSVLDSMTPAHAMLEPNRYARDFDELGILGKGGYGTVYCVKHKLDSNQYAVKVVPISAARVARIRARGQQELDDLLVELRTLARLDHPNIVRYFSGWIQWTNVASLPHGSETSSRYDHHRGNAQVWSEEPEAVLGAENNEASLGRVVTQSDEDSMGITFESSAWQNDTTAGETMEHHQQASFMSHSEIDAIDEFISPAPGPVLALHLQMAVYPTTLADFLMPSESSLDKNAPHPLAHCFHLQPSLSILMALLEGVEYLHNVGIVHRDLKPANIFMAENSNPRSTRGSVDLLLCVECRVAGTASATTLKVRIGDFGLVTALAPHERNKDARSSPVGTEIYRPLAATSNASPSLDIFALGIIAFELLWPFSTRMERHDTILRLKHGQFPSDFSRRVGDSSGEVKSCVRDMLSQDHDRVTSASLKKRIAFIQAAQT
ncbi:hypothetical protein LTR85_005283 [Meristemomyces frigidus]|nr:hypothetical protein LTR85_005283 [Meristemomyces frigidus]